MKVASMGFVEDIQVSLSVPSDRQSCIQVQAQQPVGNEGFFPSFSVVTSHLFSSYYPGYKSHPLGQTGFQLDDAQDPSQFLQV